MGPIPTPQPPAGLLTIYPAILSLCYHEQPLTQFCAVQVPVSGGVTAMVALLEVFFPSVAARAVWQQHLNKRQLHLRQPGPPGVHLFTLPGGRLRCARWVLVHQVCCKS